MTTKEDLIYRQVVTLRDGARVLLRPLVPEDLKALQDMFLHIPEEEARTMRHDVHDPELVGSWATQVNYDEIFPIIAVVGDRIVGNATLHFNNGPYRHRAELRIFLARDFRQRGLGTKMIHAIIDIARRRSLYILEVQVLSRLVTDIKAMQKAGFETVCVFEDHFMLPDGELNDVVYMNLHLRKSESEF